LIIWSWLVVAVVVATQELVVGLEDSELEQR
jgi:hypothetical protein